MEYPCIKPSVFPWNIHGEMKIPRKPMSFDHGNSMVLPWNFHGVTMDLLPSFP